MTSHFCKRMHNNVIHSPMKESKMQDFSAAKAIVRNAYLAIDSDHQTLCTTLAQFYSDNILWRGFHPFNELVGINTVAERFWKPLHNSLKNLQRREDIFFAGLNL